MPVTVDLVIAVAGYLKVHDEDRDSYVAASRGLVERGRRAEGCLDLSITADSVDPGRINNFELWASQEALDAFRAVADPPDTGIQVIEATMTEYLIARTRDPFSKD